MSFTYTSFHCQGKIKIIIQHLRLYNKVGFLVIELLINLKSCHGVLIDNVNRKEFDEVHFMFCKSFTETRHGIYLTKKLDEY